MEPFNTNDEFQEFLQEGTENNRIYPSEHVWESIREELHGNRSWPALTFIAFFIIVSLTVSTVFNYPPDAIIAKTNNVILPNTATLADNQDDQTIPSADNEKLQEQINPERFTERTFANLQQNELNTVEPASLINNTTVINQAVTNTSSTNAIAIDKITSLNPNSTLGFSEPEKQNLNDEAAEDNNADYLTNTQSLNTTVHKNNKVSIVTKEEDPNNDPTADGYMKEFGFEKTTHQQNKSKFSLQLYFTPSVSYRKLEDDISGVNYLNNLSNPSAQNLPTNVNNAVHHRPALGTEVGAVILYNLTPSIKIKAGLQFNVRQYYIDAYQSYGLATFALVQNNHLDSVSYFTAFSNNSSGRNETKLDNKLYQVSIPIGLQWDFVDSKKFGASIGATIQPTFTLNKSVYMISTDYKYYANGSPFFRKWNMNTGIDLTFTYKTGNLKWYLGPQIRYQHLPTYNDAYPIKEYRWDYGLKLGVTMPLH